jgi:iron(III) transport system ATP-binding protein
MNVPLWRLDAVTVPGRRGPRLDRVSVEILSGVTAVLGPSGAGKTTLLNLLVGFEKPSSGRIEMLIAPSDRLAVFWVPPGHGLWPQVTVRNHLASIMPNSEPVPVEQLLQDFDLLSLSAAYPGTLSQGERDRLSLVRAIASKAQVLVLDEPLAHVPPEAALRYWSALRSACAEWKTSVVLATHDPDVAAREASQVIVLEAGRVAHVGVARK